MARYYCLILLFIATGFSGCQNQSEDKQVIAVDSSATTKKHKDTIHIVAVGDMMLGSAFPSKTNLPPDDGVNSFKSVAHLLKGDIVFGNLEGCFLNDGKSIKCEENTYSCFAFRMPDRYASIFKDAGFNVLSLANNHIGDFGAAGRKNTARLLDSLQIHYAGQLQKPFDLFEIDGVKYGFIAFAPNLNTVDIRNIRAAKQQVANLKELADIVLVSFHGGGEGAKFEHVTRETEVYYEENRGNVYEFAHAVIDAGADIVLGHGPHVTRAVEVYKKKFIAYSLGNFCTYGMFSLQGANGIASLMQIKLNTKGDFLYADVVSVKQHKIKRLTIDDTHGAFKKIAYLTATDFNGHNLKFEDNRISLKNEQK